MKHPDPFKNPKERRAMCCWWCGDGLGQVVLKITTPDGREESVHKYCKKLFEEETCTQQ